MNIAIFRDNQTPQYLKSVNTPEYEGDVDVVFNPDVSGVESVPLKYWKRNGNNVEEMTESEKQIVEDEELLARKSSANNYGIGIKIALTALIKVVNLRLPDGKKITKLEMVTALKDEIT